MTTPLLLEDLKRDEGFRARAYQDGRGVWTIGYGHAHCDPRAVWTLDQAEAQLAVDVDLACEAPRPQPSLVARAWTWCARTPWPTWPSTWASASPPAPPVRRAADCRASRRMLAALQAGDYPHASAQMLLSDWAKDPPEGVGARAGRLAAMIRTGERHP